MQHDKEPTKFCMVIKLDVMKNFTGSTPPHAWPNFLLIQMLMRDLLAVANLLVRHPDN